MPTLFISNWTTFFSITSNDFGEVNRSIIWTLQLISGRIVVSADGKSRTVTTSGIDSKGKKVSSTAFYGKQ